MAMSCDDHVISYTYLKPAACKFTRNTTFRTICCFMFGKLETETSQSHDMKSCFFSSYHNFRNDVVTQVTNLWLVITIFQMLLINDHQTRNMNNYCNYLHFI